MHRVPGKLDNRCPTPANTLAWAKCNRPDDCGVKTHYTFCQGRGSQPHPSTGAMVVPSFMQKMLSHHC